MQISHTTISKLCPYIGEAMLNVILKTTYHNLLSLINRFGKSGGSVGFSTNIVAHFTVSFSDLTFWAITIKL